MTYGDLTANATATTTMAPLTPFLDAPSRPSSYPPLRRRRPYQSRRRRRKRSRALSPRRPSSSDDAADSPSSQLRRIRPPAARRRRRRRRRRLFSRFLPLLPSSSTPFVQTLLVLLVLLAARAPGALPADVAPPPPPSPPSPLPNKCTLRPPSSLPAKPPPVVIGHRGASYNLPEHTLAGYRLALELGADYIEPDLVPTKDGALVAIHSINLNITTDVWNVDGLKDRYRTEQTADGADEKRMYYVHDFTLDEIRQLKVKQRVESGARSTHFDYMFGIPTLSEIIDLLHEWHTDILPEVGWSKRKVGGRPGLYAELKSPTFLLDDANISVVDLLLDELSSHEHAYELFFNETSCRGLKFDEWHVPPLVVQCFDANTLREFHDKFLDRPPIFDRYNASMALQPQSRIVDPPPSVLLVSKSKCHKENFWLDLEEYQHVLNGVGPDKDCLLGGPGESGFEEEITPEMGKEWVLTAQIEHGLAVHPWTERLETTFFQGEHLATYGGGGSGGGFDDAEQETQYLFCDLGIDGIFAENVDLAKRVGYAGCPTDEEKKKEEKGGEGNEATVCYENQTDEMIAVGLSVGVVGMLIGTLVTYGCCVGGRGGGIRSGRLRRRGRNGGDGGGEPRQVVHAALDEDDLEML